MKIFAANWKLNKTPAETKVFFEIFFEKMKLSSQIFNQKIIFFPPSTSLETTAQCLSKFLKEIDTHHLRTPKNESFENQFCYSWGAQNIYKEKSGAFTGETSAQTIQLMGAEYALVGHSERRQYFNETDDLLAEKVKVAQSVNLIPVLCVGETLEQRETGTTNQVVKRQLENGLALMDRSKPVIIAYEPVWAIGTGKVASLEQVRETHLEIFKILKNNQLERTPILYGGSVKPDNSKELLSVEHVSGFLVGGASLDPESFYTLVGMQNETRNKISNF